MTPANLMLLGFRARLIIELPDGEHDISHLLKVRERPTRLRPDLEIETAVCVSITDLVNEIAIERRARERAASR